MPEEHPFTSNRWFNNINNLELLNKWFINRNINNEVLSFAYMPDKEIKSIFLGTFPIWEIVNGELNNQNLEFFYGSVVNDFWNCLGQITGEPIDDLNNRITTLDNLKIGITDILQKIDREPANCNSDRCLTGLNYNSILDLKTFFPNLKNIFITSGGKGPIGNLNNNKSVATWLKDSLNNNHIEGFNLNEFVKPITINEIQFNLIYLYSPSNSTNIPIQGILNAHNNFGIPNLNIQTFRKLQWGYFLRKFHFSEINIDNNNVEQIWNIVNENELLLNYFGE